MRALSGGIGSFRERNGFKCLIMLTLPPPLTRSKKKNKQSFSFIFLVIFITYSHKSGVILFDLFYLLLLSF